MKGESLFKHPALIGYLVRKIREKYPRTQVGKTMIQKMIYFLVRMRTADFAYSLYHYGPYSFEVAEELNFAEQSGIIKSEWVVDKGYFIEPTSGLDRFNDLLEPNEKAAIRNLVDKFGDLTAIQLSIIATAFFLKDNFSVPNERLAEVVKSIKPMHRIDFIKKALKKAEIVKA